MRKKIILVVLCVISMHTICGQEYYFRHYQVENGLSHNTVFTSIQDKHGFIWLGTKIGLNRFDGHNFNQYQFNSNDPKSLGCNIVKTLYEFGKYIWVGTDNGLYRFDENKEEFHLIASTKEKAVSDINSDSDGNLWYLCNGNPIKYSIKENKRTSFPKMDNNGLNTISKDKNGTIWFSSSQNFFNYSSKSNDFKKYKVTHENNNNLPFIITKILASKQTNSIIIGTQNHGIICYNKLKKSFEKLPISNIKSLYIRDLKENENGDLWIASEFGLFIYNYKTKVSRNFKKNYYNPYSISDNAIYSITFDSEGGMWIGTYFGGINYSPKSYTPFQKYFTKFGENSINGNVVREIIEDKHGAIWIGTEDSGLNKLVPSTGIITNFYHSNNDESLSYHNIHGLLVRGDTLWIGTFEHGLDLMNVNNGKVIKHYKTGGVNSLKSNFVYSIFETKSKEVLLLTTAGIQKYDFKKKNFISISGLDDNNFFNSILEDKNRLLWIGSVGSGLFVYNPFTKSKIQYRYNPKDPKSISSNNINSVFMDSTNNIWIATENGLNLYNPINKKFKRFTIENGFPSNTIYKIVEEKENIFWVSTSNGLVKFNPQTEKIEIFTKSDGLLSNQFNYCSGYKDKNETIYFGSAQGLISFNPKEFIINTYKPVTVISKLQINNKEVTLNEPDSPLKNAITFTKDLILKNNQSSFGFSFSTLSYNSPEMSEYWYKMEGLNNNWVSLKKNNFVFFTELPARKYKFSVKSKNKNGMWSTKSQILNIEVLPTIWQSNTAYFIYIMLLFLMAYWGLSFYHKKIQSSNQAKINELNNKKEKELHQAKIEFFNHISHEIKTPLTLIKSPLDNILKKISDMPDLKENLRIIDKNTKRLLDLVNQLLDFRKTEMGNINLSFVENNITKLIKQTHFRFSNAIKDKKIDFKIDLGDHKIVAFVDTEALKKILSNLFSNAIKYCDHEISITLNQNEKNFEFTIKNDGNVIPSHLRNKIFEPFYRVQGVTQTGTGIGLSLAHSLAELHKGSLKVDINDNIHNIFIMTLPLRQEKEFSLYSSKKAEERTPITEEENNIPEKSYRDTILVVEDNEDLLDYVAKELSKNYHVIKAQSAEEALEILQDNNIQLIVSDVIMSELTGFDLCEIVKNKLETCHIPVVLLTSKSLLKSKITGLKSGADAYIEKPFSIDYLKLQISTLLKNREKLLSYISSSPLAHIRSIAHTTTDEVFIKKIDQIIIKNIEDQELSVDTLAEIMNMSRSTFYRKIKNISQLSPNELINITRLKKAAELLKTGKYKVYEVSIMVGYNSQTSFGRNFQKQFKMTPTEYMNTP